MLATLIAFIVIAVLLGSAAAIGGGVALPVLLVLAGLVAVAWFAVTAGGARRSPGDVVRRTRSREFFGPGGPDDPNAPG